MPEQFTVPQFIDAEDKIIGPITVRQFLILVVGGLIVAISYRAFDFQLFLLVSVPSFILSVILAFLKVNGVSVHYFMINAIQTFRKPRLRVWDKTITEALLKERLKPEDVVESSVQPHKPPLNLTRTQELTLLVNTGGVYNPEARSYDK